jgi:putative membrane protein
MTPSSRLAGAVRVDIGRVAFTLNLNREIDMLASTVFKRLLGAFVVFVVWGSVAAQTPAQVTPSGARTIDVVKSPDTAAKHKSKAAVPGQTSSGVSGTAGYGTGSGSVASGTPIAKADRKIVLSIAQSDMAEIDMARLAQTKSGDADVKAFAQKMIDDHTKMLTEVQQLAQAKGLTLPTELDKKHRAAADKLGAKSGPAFDRAYLEKGGVSDHKKLRRMLQQAQAQASDPDVKALAERILPSVEQHLQSAEHVHGMKTAKKGAKGA